MEDIKIVASIVLYKNNPKILITTINSFLNSTLGSQLYLIDNSPTNELKSLFEIEKRIVYIHNPSNPGFGAAHNIAIKKAIELNAIYHFVINPDVYFDVDVITPMVNYMSNDASIGMLMPEVLNADGSIQNLPKLLPSPLSIILRKLKRPVGFYQRFINKYELRFVKRDMIYNAPILSGCFTLLNLKAIEEIGGYDDSYFMYFEDWDLSRRMTEKYRTVYFPKVSIYHDYDSGANKSFLLFKIFLKSAFYYFSKWGWFFDSKRKRINNQTLSQFK